MATQTATQPASVSNTTTTKKNEKTAELLVRSLMQQNVKYIFGIPGGKRFPKPGIKRD